MDRVTLAIIDNADWPAKLDELIGQLERLRANVPEPYWGEIKLDFQWNKDSGWPGRLVIYYDL